jgi:hypothetical protein
MPVVLGGYGQPEDGAIVAHGLGTSEPAPPGSMSATLSGSGSLSATLTAAGGEPDPPRRMAGHHGRLPKRAPKNVKVKPGWMSVALTGGGALSAEVEFTYDPGPSRRQAEEELLLVGAF